MTPDPGPHPDPTGPRLTGSARLLAYSLRAGPNPGPTGTPCAAPAWPPTLHSWLATQQPLPGKRSLAPGRAAPAFASGFMGWPCLVHQGQPQCPEQNRLLKQSVGPRGQKERRGPWPDPWGGRRTRGPDLLAQREDGGAVGRGAEGSGGGRTPPRDPRAPPRAPLSGEGAGGPLAQVQTHARGRRGGGPDTRGLVPRAHGHDRGPGAFARSHLPPPGFSEPGAPRPRAHLGCPHRPHLCSRLHRWRSWTRGWCSSRTCFSSCCPCTTAAPRGAAPPAAAGLRCSPAAPPTLSSSCRATPCPPTSS